MADSLGIAGELEQQSETLVADRVVLGHDAVGVLFLVQDVLAEAIRDQRQFQVAGIAGVVVDDVENHVIGIEVRVLALRVHTQRHRAGHPHRLLVGDVAVLVEGRLGVVAVLEAELHLVASLHVGFLQSKRPLSQTVSSNKTSYIFSSSIHTSDLWKNSS